MFGQPSGQSSGFSFGGTKPATGSAFGQTQPAFGQAPATGFGQPGSVAPAAGSSLFGQNTTQNSTSTAFGAPKPQQGFGFGAQTQTQPSGGLFGNTQQNQTAQQPNQQQPQQGGSLFGQPSGGLFGGQNQQPAQQQQQPAGGLLGGAANTTAATPSGLFGSTNNASTTSGSSLFGQHKPAGQTTQPGQTGGLFGNTQSTTTQPSGGLFGSSQPAQSGGLFGNTANQQQQPGQASTGGLFGSKPAGTGLFGNTTQPQASTGGGLFGNAAAKPSTGLFGNQTQNTATTGLGGQTGGLFGGSLGQNQQQPQTGGGLFGAPAQPAQAGGFGFGAPAQPQAPAQPAVNITPLTRPSDLPENVQKVLEGIDTYISQQIRTSDELKNDKDEHRELIESVPRDVDLLQHKLITATEALKYDGARLSQLKNTSIIAVSNAERCFEVFDTLRPAGTGRAQPWSDRKDDRLLPYFTEHTNALAERLDQLAEAVNDVNRGVSALESRGAVPLDPNAIATTLQDEYSYFMGLTDRVAELHQNASRLKRT